MKASFWDKVLMFLYVLVALTFAVCMALRAFGVDLLGGMFAGLEHAAGHFLSVVIGLGLAAIVVLLSAYMLMMIFGRGKKRVPASFITVNTDDGAQVHMSLNAIAQMARQAIGRVPDVREMKIGVKNEDDAVSVSVDLTLKATAHVPTVTKNMQKAIRNSIESNCGVAVRDVEIIVSSLSGADMKPEWKKPRWKLGRKGKEESVEAIAAQEAAEPLTEIPTAADAGVDDASADAHKAEEAPAEDEWTGSFAPLEDGPGPLTLDEEEDDAAEDEEDADKDALFLYDDDDDDGEGDGPAGDEAEEAHFTPATEADEGEDEDKPYKY